MGRKTNKHRNKQTPAPGLPVMILVDVSRRDEGEIMTPDTIAAGSI